MSNLFIVDLKGPVILEIERDMLQHPNVGALILFTRNFENPEQLKKLIAEVRSLRRDIFIAIDHEGGIVQRLQRHGFRSLPAARVYGDVYDLNPEAGIQLARNYGEIMAKDLLAYGIDLSFAPVLDIHGASNIIGKLDRAFHIKPEIVAILSEAFIDGMHAAGMPSVAKHFPGHGSCSLDSHIEKPIYEISMTELRDKDLKPFVTLIQRNKLDGIMPAHLSIPAIDAENAAGFSKIWLKSLLRQDLKFNGLIISDCLGMAGADIGNMETRAQCALEAGCEMLIVCNQSSPEFMIELLNAVQFKPSTASVLRLAEFKQKMLGFSGVTAEHLESNTYFPLTASLSVGDANNTSAKASDEVKSFSSLNTTRSI